MMMEVSKKKIETKDQQEQILCNPRDVAYRHVNCGSVQYAIFSKFK